MPIYEFTSPNGKTYEVEGPGTKEEAFQQLKAHLGTPPSTPRPQQGPPMPNTPAAAEMARQSNDPFVRAQQRGRDWNETAQSVVDVGKQAAFGAAKGVANMGQKTLDYGPVGIASKGIAALQKSQGEPVTFPVNGQTLPNAVEEVLPDPQTNAQEIARDIGQTVGPSLLMGGAGATAMAGRGILGQLFGAALGDAIGFTSSKDDQGPENRLLVGKVLPGFDDETQMGIALNDFADAFAIAGLGGAIGAGAMGAMGAFYKALIKPVFTSSQKSIENELGMLIATELRKIQDFTDPKMKQQGLNQLADLLKANKEKLIPGPEDQGQIAVLRDSMRSLAEGLEATGRPDDRKMAMRAREILKGHLVKAGTVEETALKMSQPTDALEESVELSKSALGGERAIKEGADDISNRALAAADEAFEQPIAQVEEELGEATAEIPRMFREATTGVGNKLDDLGTPANIDVSAQKQGSINTLTDSLDKAFDDMDAEIARLIDNIPDDATIDLTPVADSVAAMPKAVQTMISDADANYKTLYQSVIPKLKTLKQQAINSNSDYTDIDILRDHIYSSGLADDMRKFYREEYVPLRKGGVLGDFDKLRKGEPNDFAGGTRDLFSRAASDEVRMEQITRVLTSKFGNNKPEQALDLVTGSIAENIQSQINQGATAQTLDFNQIIRDLEKHGAVINSLSPKLKAQYDDFVTSIVSKRDDIAGLTKQLTEFQRKLPKQREAYLTENFSDFLKSSGVKKELGFESFESLFDSNDIPKFRKVLETAKQDPETLSGMKAAYLKHLKNKAFKGGGKISKTGRKGVNPNRAAEITDVENTLARYGDELFEDSPTAYHATLSMIKEASKSSDFLKNAEQLALQGRGEQAKGMSTGLDRIITIIWGPLSRAGARIRSLKGLVVKGLDQQTLIDETTDTLLAHPDQLEEVWRRLAAQEGRKWSAGAKQALAGYLALTFEYLPEEQRDYILEEITGTNEMKELGLQ